MDLIRLTSTSLINQMHAQCGINVVIWPKNIINWIFSFPMNMKLLYFFQFISHWFKIKKRCRLKL